MTLRPRAPGPGSRVLECFAHFVGDADESLRNAGQRALARGAAHLTALEAVEHLFQGELESLIRPAIRPRDDAARDRQTDAGNHGERLGERERWRDHHGGRRHAPSEDGEDGSARDTFGPLLANVRLEPHQTEPWLELHDLSADLRGARERIAALARQGALDRCEHYRGRL